MASLWSLLLLSLLLNQVTSERPVLKKCTGRKPGKPTGGCQYTCNRRLGQWRQNSCGTNTEHGETTTSKEDGQAAPRICGLALAPGYWWPDQDCPGEESWDDFLGSCVPNDHTCEDHEWACGDPCTYTCNATSSTTVCHAEHGKTKEKGSCRFTFTSGEAKLECETPVGCRDCWQLRGVDECWTARKEEHCADGSDEIVSECGEDAFHCNNSKCISLLKSCDGTDDCGDGSDEKEEAGCFRCRNNATIWAGYRCDGQFKVKGQDCADGSDELGCQECVDGAFLCDNGKCVRESVRCNGRDDCGDKSDEKDEHCKRFLIDANISGYVECEDDSYCPEPIENTEKMTISTFTCTGDVFQQPSPWEVRLGYDGHYPACQEIVRPLCCAKEEPGEDCHCGGEGSLLRAEVPAGGVGSLRCPGPCSLSCPCSQGGHCCGQVRAGTGGQVLLCPPSC